MSYDIDYWAEAEAAEYERLDADIEWADAVATANAVHRAQKKGQCFHSSAVGYAGKVFYAEQQGLKKGQIACRSHVGGCNKVWNSEADFAAEQRELYAGL